jgi:hypothetical protein
VQPGEQGAAIEVGGVSLGWGALLVGRNSMHCSAGSSSQLSKAPLHWQDSILRRRDVRPRVPAALAGAGQFHHQILAAGWEAGADQV